MKDHKSNAALDGGVLTEEEGKRLAFLAGLNESREEFLMYISGVTPRRMPSAGPVTSFAWKASPRAPSVPASNTRVRTVLGWKCRVALQG